MFDEAWPSCRQEWPSRAGCAAVTAVDATVDFVLAIHPAATAAPYLWPCSWATTPRLPGRRPRHPGSHGDGRRRRHGNVFFAAQLPGGVHPDIFSARDYGRVVVQLPHNYPAAAHFALLFIWDDRHRCHGDVFFAAQLPGGVHPGTFFAQDYCRVVR